MVRSVNPSTNRDLQQLKKMLDSYNKLAAKLENPTLPDPERQSIKAALHMLKEFMTDRTRDLKRHLRETREY